MRYEWWIAKRYLWSTRRHPFVGVISTISVLGVAVGVAALIVVLAVMNGFDEDLKERIIGTRAHLVIEKEDVLPRDASLLTELDRIPGVVGTSYFIEGQALVLASDSSTGVLVRGVDPEREPSVSKILSKINPGSLSTEPNTVTVGAELARRLRLVPGSSLQMFSQRSKTPFVCRVTGLFSSGMYEYDANLVFMNLENAERFFEAPGAASGIAVRLHDSERAKDFKRLIQRKLGKPYFVQTWMDQNSTLFGALKLEKMVMFLILALIIFVACLNIAGSLTILVMDKTKDIGVLKALGAQPSSLLKIFAADGLLVGLVGALAGLAGGLVLCFLLKKYTWIELPKEIYYLDKLPVNVKLVDTGAVVLVAVVLSFLSALYPARIAAKLDPVKALRYE